MLELILVQGFCPQEMKIIQFPTGSSLILLGNNEIGVMKKRLVF